ncbi:hypothetical protein Tco_0483155 [Tanacetum coccineum]
MCGPVVVAGANSWGMNPFGSFPCMYSPATCPRGSLGSPDQIESSLCQSMNMSHPAVRGVGQIRIEGMSPGKSFSCRCGLQRM